MLDCKLICRLHHTFYCRSKQAISYEKLFPKGTNVFYWIFVFEYLSQPQLRRRLMVKTGRRSIWTK